MNLWFKKYFRMAGVDRAIGYTLVARVLGVVATPVTMILIAHCMTRAEQGYYFTFGNLLALIMFLDLGLISVLQLFASHEKAALAWGPQGALGGDPRAMARLNAVRALARRWCGGVSILTLVVLLPIGLVFFARKDAADAVAWQIPWIVAAVVTAIGALMNPFISLLEACGLVTETRGVGVVQALVSYPLMWLAIVVGGGLFAGSVFWGCGLVVCMIWLGLRYPAFVREGWRARPDAQALPWREIWPLQWRTAVGCISGYLFFQLFGPMLFKLRGPEEAGQMGMSVMLVQTLGGVGLAWVGTKAPQLGILWARRDFVALDALFFPALWRLVGVILGGGAVLTLGLLVLLRIGHPYAMRVLAPLPLALLVVVQALNSAVMAQSTYLRANKQEPLVWISVAYGVAILASNWALCSRYGADGMIVGSLVLSILFCAACAIVLLNCRRQWQQCA